MSSGPVNQSPFLRTSRSFPEGEVAPLALEINRCYVDIANKVNDRTIGLYPTTKPALNGKSWFLFKNQKQQGFRQVYTFTSYGNIPHGINLANIYGFTQIYGTFTDGTNWYPLPYVASPSTAQVQIIVDPVNIQINNLGTAPTITKGIIVLEWISEP